MHGDKIQFSTKLPPSQPVTKSIVRRRKYVVLPSSVNACLLVAHRTSSVMLKKKISVNLAVKNVPHNFIHMTTLRVRRKCPSFPSIEPGDGLRDKSDIVRIKAFACSIENIVDGQISTLPPQSMPLSRRKATKKGTAVAFRRRNPSAVPVQSYLDPAKCPATFSRFSRSKC